MSNMGEEKNLAIGAQKNELRLSADKAQDSLATQQFASRLGSGESWYTDAYTRTLFQRNLLAFIAVICVIIVLFSIITVRYVKNSQKMEPFVIEIDSKTGVPSIVEPVSIKKYTADEVLRKYFITQYISAREGYAFQTFNYNYYKFIRALSTPEIYYAYRTESSPRNPMSPYMVYGQNTTRDIQMKSIVMLSENTAQARFRQVLGGSSGNVNGNNGGGMDRVAIIGFTFNNVAQMSEEDRAMNPLGFTVVFYKAQDEATHMLMNK